MVHALPLGSYLWLAPAQVSVDIFQTLEVSVVPALMDGNLSLYEIVFNFILFYLKLCRPLWVEFPTEQNTFTVDHEYMIGDYFCLLLQFNNCPFCFSEFDHFLSPPGGALLACPVTEAGTQQVKVLLPGSADVN